MSEKKDISRKRLAEFLDSRLRARSLDRGESQRTDRDRGPAGIRPECAATRNERRQVGDRANREVVRWSRWPPALIVLAAQPEAGVARTLPERGASARSRSMPPSTRATSCAQHSARTVWSGTRPSSGRSSRRASRAALISDDDRLIAELTCDGDHLVARPQKPERAAPQCPSAGGAARSASESRARAACPRCRACARESRRDWPGRDRPSCRSRRRSRSTVRPDKIIWNSVASRRADLIAARQREEPRHVVAAQQVEHHGRHVRDDTSPSSRSIRARNASAVEGPAG